MRRGREQVPVRGERALDHRRLAAHEFGPLHQSRLPWQPSDVYINDHRIKIRAIKNIEAGQEITYNYGKDHFNAYIKPHGCRCQGCVNKRAKERAEVRAANARKKKRLARKAAQAAVAR